MTTTSRARSLCFLPAAVITLGLAACNTNDTASEAEPATAEYELPGGDAGFGIGPVIRASAKPATENAAASLDVELTLSPAAREEIHVDFMTVDGTAVQGVDYGRSKGRLSFKPGETKKSIRIPIMSDQTAEGEETFTLRLHTGSGASLERSELTLTIVDAD